MNSLKEQFDSMISRGIIPVFELDLPDDEYLIVNILCDNSKGIYFNFDDLGLKASFDGDIIKRGDSYFVKYDPCFESLDSYLELIHENVIEGFILPNNLFVEQ